MTALTPSPAAAYRRPRGTLGGRGAPPPESPGL